MTISKDMYRTVRNQLEGDGKTHTYETLAKVMDLSVASIRDAVAVLEINNLVVMFPGRPVTFMSCGKDSIVPGEIRTYIQKVIEPNPSLSLIRQKQFKDAIESDKKTDDVLLQVIRDSVHDSRLYANLVNLAEAVKQIQEHNELDLDSLRK